MAVGTLPSPGATRRWRTDPPEVVFVFPSGGSTGAAQVGVLRSLVAAGIRPDAVVGSSVGALNAAFFAQHPCLAQVDRLARIWLALSRRDVFGGNPSGRVVRLLARRDHIYAPAAVQALIARFCTMRALEEAHVPVHVVTTDLDHGVARWWTEGPAHDILYASICLPGLFPPALFDGRRHVDGGVLEPVPVRRALDLDASVVYVLGEPRGPEDRLPGRLTAIEVLIRSFAISRYARLPEPEAMAHAGQRVVVVPGADTLGIDITDFSRTAALIKESRRASEAFLEGHRLFEGRRVPPAAPSPVG